MFESGVGVPVVVVPGIQGRWEWMRPAVDALAKRCRVISFSLCGDPGSGERFDVSQGIETFTRQIDRVLDGAGLERATLCGVSLGGLIATRYAAARPDRVQALVLVSSPGPRWTPDGVQRLCARLGALGTPLFVLSTGWRLWPEMVSARGGVGRGAIWILGHLRRVLAAPASPRRMQQRLQLWVAADRLADCRAVSAPTLVIAGENGLDRVVKDTTREFGSAIRGARVVTLERTGHIGLVTRPDAFAEVVSRFAEDAAHPGAGRNPRSAAR
jgi:pimeloyl-ACP methyl ester carboxylesterase